MGRVWRWALVIVVVLAAYLFLSIPSAIYLNEHFDPNRRSFTDYQRQVISWVWAAFVIAGPVAIGVALYQRIDDHEKRRRRELGQALAIYLRQTFQNGWQRWDAGISLGRTVTSRFGWHFEEGNELRAELTSFDGYRRLPHGHVLGPPTGPSRRPVTYRCAL